jgi:hypothetical protein
MLKIQTLPIDAGCIVASIYRRMNEYLSFILLYFPFGFLSPSLSFLHLPIGIEIDTNFAFLGGNGNIVLYIEVKDGGKVIRKKNTDRHHGPRPIPSVFYLPTHLLTVQYSTVQYKINF